MCQPSQDYPSANVFKCNNLKYYQYLMKFLFYPESSVLCKLCFCWKTHLDARETFQAGSKTSRWYTKIHFTLV